MMALRATKFRAVLEFLRVERFELIQKTLSISLIRNEKSNYKNDLILLRIKMLQVYEYTGLNETRIILIS